LNRITTVQVCDATEAEQNYCSWAHNYFANVSM